MITMDRDTFKRAPHNPPHLFVPDMMYMLTASIYSRQPLMLPAKRKAEWIAAFCEAAGICKWNILAWVVLDNHYHAIVQSPTNARTLSKFVASYHKYTARKWNDEDECTGRKVWWNYWDTCLQNEHAFYTRLRYMFWNPVKHGLCNLAEEYSYSNYLQFMANWDVIFDIPSMEEVKDVPEF